MPQVPSTLREITIEEIQQGLASGYCSATSLAAEYLERIETLDWNGIALRSVIETNPDIFTIARELE